MDFGPLIDWSSIPPAWSSEEDGTSFWLPLTSTAGRGVPPPLLLLPYFLRRVASVAVCVGVVLAAGKLICVVVRRLQQRRLKNQQPPAVNSNNHGLGSRVQQNDFQRKPVLESKPISLRNNRVLTVIPSPARPVAAPQTSGPSPNSTSPLPLPHIPSTEQQIAESTYEFSDHPASERPHYMEEVQQSAADTSEFSLSFNDGDGSGTQEDSLELMQEDDDRADQGSTEETVDSPEVVTRVLVTIL